MTVSANLWVLGIVAAAVPVGIALYHWVGALLMLTVGKI